MHEAVNAEQCNALAINGNLNLFAAGQAAGKGARGFVEEVHVAVALALRVGVQPQFSGDKVVQA